MAIKERVIAEIISEVRFGYSSVQYQVEDVLAGAKSLKGLRREICEKIDDIISEAESAKQAIVKIINTEIENTGDE